MIKMKKIFILLVFSTLMVSLQAQKIGYVNSAALMADLPEVKSADSNLEGFQTQLQKKGEQMVQQLQAKYQDLKNKQAKGEISPKDLEIESEKLREEEAKIGAYEQDMNKKVMDKRQELFQPILDKVNLAINDVSKDKGYTYVIDGSIGLILYADPANDLTEAVKSKLSSQGSVTGTTSGTKVEEKAQPKKSGK